MMKYHKKNTLLFLFLLTFSFLFSGESFSDMDKNIPFSTGEKITYSIKKIGVKAGEATLAFEGTYRLNTKKAYLIVFTVRGLNFFDEEKIFVDPDTFYPVLVERNLNIWGKKEKISEHYLSGQGQVKIIKNAGGKISEQTIEKKGKLDNIYSFIYRYRQSGTFQLGENLLMNLPTKDVNLKLKEVTKLKAAGKKFDAYYMTSDPSQYEVWFDNSAKKIPLKINGAVGFGDTTMVMVDYKE